MKIAGVRFRDNWRIYDFDATNVTVSVGDRVIVESERGLGFALVVRIREGEASAVSLPEPREKPRPQEPEVEVEIEIDIDDVDAPKAPEQSQPAAPGQRQFRKVLRAATEDDISRHEKNSKREAEAFAVAQEMIGERELPMKLIRAEYSFDAARVTFYFFSENRVDFRELVKDLAHKLRSRIEMRQVGVRDVARMIGGFGPCGRELCCTAFLKGFEPVSIRMAKKQDMVLNPAKISGVCGRLLCCLSYEYATYDAIKKDIFDMRDAAVREKKEEEERRLDEERKAVEAQRQADEKRRQEDQRRRQDTERDRQRSGEAKVGKRQEKKKDERQERKVQAPGEQGQKQKQRQQQPSPRPEQKLKDDNRPPKQEQGAAAEEQGKEKEGRRFWRKKKRKKGGSSQQGGGKPQGPAGGSGQ